VETVFLGIRFTWVKGDLFVIINLDAVIEMGGVVEMRTLRLP